MRRSTVGNKDSEETFVRRSTVVKKDTASCDIVGHGSRRSEINGETIMRRSTVVKTDNSANINRLPARTHFFITTACTVQVFLLE